MSFKKINAWLHLWLGLVSGIVVVILSLTGCILVFQQEIKSLTSPWLKAEKALGRPILRPSVLFQTVKKQVPGKEIHNIWYHGSEGTVTFAVGADSSAYADPYSGKLIAVKSDKGFFHFVDDGHRRVWLPDKIGHQLVGWSTFIFFTLLISGMILWWPKKWTTSTRNKSFKIKWNAKWRRVNYDLHNVLGFYSLLVALVISLTGLTMTFSWFSSSIYFLTGGKNIVTREADPKDTLKADTSAIPLAIALAQVDKAWYKAIHELASYNKGEVLLSIPEKKSEPIYVCTDMRRGSWRDIYLDQHTLKELPASQLKLKEEQLANWLRRSNYSIHLGYIGGLTTKILYFITSFICGSLPLTGFYIWWKKKK